MTDEELARLAQAIERALLRDLDNTERSFVEAMGRCTPLLEAITRALNTFPVFESVQAQTACWFGTSQDQNRTTENDNSYA